MDPIFVIKNSDNEYYKPGGYGGFWRPTFKKAKKYSNIGHAKSAITGKLKDASWLNSKCISPEYAKLVNCTIMKIVNGEEVIAWIHTL